MPTYSAVNPRHTSVVEIDNLWWMKDAWNERTTEWFSADRERARGLFQGVLSLTRLNVPEFLPSPEWLAQVCNKVFDLELVHCPGVGGLFQTVYALEAKVDEPDTWKRKSDLVVAANLLSSMIPLSDENLPKAVTASSYEGLAVGVVSGVGANPTLPALTAPLVEGSGLTPYRWMAKKALTESLKLPGVIQILESLAANLGASTEDLEFLLHQVDLQEQETEQASKDGRGSLGDALEAKEIANIVHGIVRVHPNFISWPSVAQFEAERGERLQDFHAHRSTAVTSDRSELNPAYSEEHIDDMLGRPSFYPMWMVEQSLAGSLLHALDRSLTQKLEERLRLLNQRAGYAKGMREAESGSAVDAEIAARSFTGFYAPVLGAIFADLDAKFDNAGVPLEWLLEAA